MMSKMSIILFLLCSMFFVSCSDDNDEGSGINGTYATSGEYDNYTGKTFREMIVITKSSFTTYSTQAVQDKSYWGAGAFQVPGAKGWYVEKGSQRIHSYVRANDRIILDNGSIYSIGNNSIVGGGHTYYKY